jgi:hypothetical protein
MYLQDETYKPEIKSVTFNTTRLILSNPNLQSLLDENLDKIIEMISHMYPVDAAECLVSFRLPKNRNSLKVVRALLTRVVESHRNKRIMEGVDLVGITRSLQDNYLLDLK